MDKYTCGKKLLETTTTFLKYIVIYECISLAIGICRAFKKAELKTVIRTNKITIRGEYKLNGSPMYHCHRHTGYWLL